MRYLLFVNTVLYVFLFSACYTPRMYQRAAFPLGSDTSVVYRIPVLEKSKVFISQGYHGLFSHQHTFALDFKLKKNTPVCAAREGLVVRTESKFNKGGTSRRWIDMANYVEIRHDDGTMASYWHLQHNSIMVKVGERVLAGQQIALSGSTGFSSMPHLHFELWGIDKNGYKTFPSYFSIRKTRKLLQVGKIYRIK